jgi:hypothetical protein
LRELREADGLASDWLEGGAWHKRIRVITWYLQQFYISTSILLADDLKRTLYSWHTAGTGRRLRIWT